VEFERVSDLLAFRRVSKRFGGVVALRDVSLELRQGEIRCLVGENGSGKSTLVKILAGVYRPDAGEVVIGGKAWSRLRPRDAIRLGIQIIYQELSLFPNLTVQENLAMNTLLGRRRRWVNWEEVRRIATEATERIGLGVDLSQPVSTLSLARRQLVAIARALLQDARLIVMDEPTSALTHQEVDRLFEVVRSLKRDGISILFVSHKLNEVLEISGTVTVLRNGEKVAEGATRDFDQGLLTEHMTGRKLKRSRHRYPALTSEEPSLLRLDRLSRRGDFHGVSLRLFAGEVLGIAGLLGSGRTALARSLFGLEPADSGTIHIEGRPVAVRSVVDAIANGMAYVPEDRLSEGLFLEQSIERNIVAGILDDLRGRLALLEPDRIRRAAEEWIEALGIKTPDGRDAVASLSGGNQQKTVLAKWLATGARIWILNGPTVGVDVGAKMDIHRRIRDLAERGLGVLVISDDLPEIAEICNRALLMHRGEIIEEASGAELDEKRLADSLNQLR
jgi:simple sugar transport system ATP-binding protein